MDPFVRLDDVTLAYGSSELATALKGTSLTIEKGQFADLVVPDKDFFSCAEDEISFLTSELTMVGGKIVYGAGTFAELDENPVPPAVLDRCVGGLFLAISAQLLVRR